MYLSRLISSLKLYPVWYKEHNEVAILLLNEIKKVISKHNNYSYHVNPYQGLLGLFFLGTAGACMHGALTGYLNIRKKNRYLPLVIYLINRLLDWFPYAVLRFIDIIKPFYSFAIEIDIYKIVKA